MELAPPHWREIGISTLTMTMTPSRQLRSGKTVKHNPQLLGRKKDVRKRLREEADGRKEDANKRITPSPSTRVTRSKRKSSDHIDRLVATNTSSPNRNETETKLRRLPITYLLRRSCRPEQRAGGSAAGEQYVPCTHYGKLRREKFRGQGYFFCAHCDEWDEKETLPGQKIGSRHSRRNICTAKHTSLVHPTQKKKTAWIHYTFTTKKRKKKKPARASEASSTQLPKPSVVTTSNEQSKQVESTVLYLTGENEKLRQMNEDLQEQLKDVACEEEDDADDECEYEEESNIADEDDTEQDNIMDSFKVVLLTFVEEHRRKGHKLKDIEKAIAEIVTSEDVLDGSLKRQVVEHVRKWFRKNVMSAFNVLEAMDLSGGQLSYTGLEVLRWIESKGRKYFRGFLPSTAEIQRMAKRVEAIGQTIAPFRCYNTEHGEAFDFELVPLTNTLMSAFKLDEVAKERAVTIGVGFDGAKLNKGKTHVSAGLKITDPAAISPYTRTPMGVRLDPDAQITDGPVSVQSANNCFPVSMRIMAEKSDTVNEFEELYRVMEEASLSMEEMAQPPEDAGPNPHFPGLKKFRMSADADAVGHQKATKRGGACKSKEFFCPYCCCTSSEVNVPNDERCSTWCQEIHAEDDNWACYHHEMTQDEEYLSKIETDIDIIKNLLGDIICTDGKLHLGNPDVKTDSKSIFFEPPDVQERTTFIRDLAGDLAMRHLPTTGSMEQQRQRLIEMLENEKELILLEKRLTHATRAEEALYYLFRAIPCILHLEMRVGIKLLEQLFLEGETNAYEGKIFGHIRGDVGNTRFQKYVETTETIVNKQILGTEMSPSQWRYPLSENGKETTSLKTNNRITRKLVKGMDELISLSVVDNERQVFWRSAVESHSRAMEIVRKKEDFTDDDIREYQQEADLFFTTWMKLWGRDGCTNYIHMVGCGHIAQFMYRWRNLYRHSQQGWEAMNGQLTNFFFRRTQHGGHSGGRGAGRVAKTTIKPIARWLQRRLVILTGKAEHLRLGVVDNSGTAGEFEEDIHDH